MAFADPQSIKIEATTSSLPRVETSGGESKYSNEDGTVSLKISTTNGRRRRHTIRVDQTKITDDPYNDALNVTIGESVYLVIDRPIAGFTNAQSLAAVKGFVELLSGTEYAAVKKLLGNES